MFNKNNLALVLLCALFLVSISSVCAADNTTVTMPDNNNHVIVHNATFSDLEKDIANLNPGDTYALEQDYIFDIKNDPSYVGPKIGPHGGIIISKDNITINGNGHIIDGNHDTAIFRVTGNNVKIFNLTIKNSEYRGWESPVNEIIYGKPGEPITINKVATYVDDMSPVYWDGDNGTINNCIFTGNTAINGAGITWKGDNGLINNTQFINNTARGVAGAIFITYANNTCIDNCLFRNCSSLVGEAIYLDRKHGNFTLNNNVFQDQDMFFIDGENGINAKYLQYKHYADFTDQKLDIVPYLFKSLMTGQINIIDNNTAYYPQIDVNSKNETMFTLNLVRNFMADNITYQKEYQFNNPKDANEIFEALIHAKYQNSAGIIKNIFINNKNDYEALFSKNYQELVSKTDAITTINKDKTKLKDLTKCMSIYFNSTLSIDSKTTFDICSDFKVVNIYGNGAKISADTKESNEYKWLENKEQYYTINNLTVTGFNHAIYNHQVCSLNNVVLSGNHIVFSVQPEDWGSAIVNIGTCTCTNTTFKDNHARCGGAIFNQGTLNLENCPFIGNSVEEKGFVNNMGLGTSGIGKDICNAGDGKVNIKNTDPFIDEPKVENAGGLKFTGQTIVAIAAPLVTAVVAGAIGGLTKNVAAGIAIGGLVGTAVGAIGSAIVCYNTFDATYPFLKYSLSLTLSCIVIGGLTGGLTAYSAKLHDLKIEQAKEMFKEIKAEQMKAEEIKAEKLTNEMKDVLKNVRTDEEITQFVEGYGDDAVNALNEVFEDVDNGEYNSLNKYSWPKFIEIMEENGVDLSIDHEDIFKSIGMKILKKAQSKNQLTNNIIRSFCNEVFDFSDVELRLNEINMGNKKISIDTTVYKTKQINLNEELFGEKIPCSYPEEIKTQVMKDLKKITSSLQKLNYDPDNKIISVKIMDTRPGLTGTDYFIEMTFHKGDVVKIFLTPEHSFRIYGGVLKDTELIEHPLYDKL